MSTNPVIVVDLFRRLDYNDSEEEGIILTEMLFT